MKKVTVFTDGACSGNPGPGGWGVLLRYNGTEKKLCGGAKHTTNNKMELIATIKALQALKEPCEIVLTTDSQYVKNGITKWLKNWQKSGWKTASKKPVKNRELWEQLSKELEKHVVTWHWVRGHSGHEENEIADYLARKGLKAQCDK